MHPALSAPSTSAKPVARYSPRIPNNQKKGRSYSQSQISPRAIFLSRILSMIIPTLQADVVVVGAGLSGLLAAGKLDAGACRVVVLDKGSRVGGRLATRRMDGAVFDHGAQYFTVLDPAFDAIVHDWQERGVVRPWATGFALPDGSLKRDGQERFIGISGMSAIAGHLARKLDVRLNATVARVATAGDGWEVTTENAERFSSRALLLTPPVPQSLLLLATGDVPLSHRIRKELEQIQYAPCLALLASLSGASLVPDPGGLWFPGEPIRWVADNHRKGISPGFNGAMTIHAGSEYSRQHWDTPARKVTEELLTEVASWLGTAPLQTQLYRWRYSQPISVYPERCLTVESAAPLVFAGDAFGGPRVEGAALSGLAAANALMKLLS
jgi:predicted NAD/FAD-dependent oxidoreductase